MLFEHILGFETEIFINYLFISLKKSKKNGHKARLKLRSLRRFLLLLAESILQRNSCLKAESMS